MGVNLQLARTYTPTDKAQVERVLRTIREDFIAAGTGDARTQFGKYLSSQAIQGLAAKLPDRVQAVEAEFAKTATASS